MTKSDLISRADAIEAVCGVVIDEFDVSPTRGYEVSEKALSALPSAEPSLKAIKRQIDEHWYLDPPTADAKPTVIQSKTLFPTKDFMEWAKRIREVNPNAVVIPCDAEVASAEAVQGEWVVTEHCSNEYGFRKWIEIECPFCGERPTYENLDNMNFCPNCGAIMKVGDSE